MNTTHTPGPWRQTGVNVRAGDALICWATNHHANAETLEAEKLANARLIASAPEMLQALESIVEAYQRYFDIMPVAWQSYDDRARAIISKAKGLQ